MEDKGEVLEQLISDHQDLLISEGLVQDGTPESLYEAFKNMASGKLIELPSKPFVQQWREIIGPEKSELNECQNNILQESDNNDSNTMIDFSNALLKILSNGNGLERKEVAQTVSDILNAEDLRLDYYKLSTFFVFDLIPTSAGVDYSTTILKSPTEDQIEKALDIEINHESNIICKGESMGLEHLEPVLKDYFEKNQSDAIIALKTNEKAKYRVYADVVQLIKHQILILKKELAEAKFKKSFEELNEEEMTLVNSTYPLVVIE
ncbi:hypothetical protein PY092_19035 [Muricauda sp. 334s03]|uniref:Uncharacterized protein n=2 Tax=Flagellimonas yonaguniensis TaxID=3031325 RepID=A0ABT5Y492_9FLAO|nr:hypothetical protein [[Muricauda] yonaguniensis]